MISDYIYAVLSSSGISDPPDAEISPDVPPVTGEDPPGEADPPDTELPPDVPPATGEDPPGEADPPDTETPPAVDDPPADSDFMQEVLDRLASVDDSLEDSPDFTDLLDSMHSLVDIMTLQAEESSVPSIPVTGYRDYVYPVTVQYRIFPVSLGSETSVTDSYDTPDAFEDGFSYLSDSVRSGSLAWFSIRLVTDAEGTAVYDSEALSEDPEDPGDPVEPDTFKEDVLAALNSLNENLGTVSGNMASYSGQTLEFEQQYMDLQQESLQLHYAILAGTIVMCTLFIFFLGYTVLRGFLQRMKVG